MRTYRSKISTLLWIGFIAILFTGSAGFIAVLGWQRSFPGNPWVSYPPLALIALLFLTFGIYFAYGVLFCSAVIETDAEGITRRTFWGARRLLWRDLVRFEVTGSGSDNFDLFDRNGCRLEVSASVLKNGEELHLELEERLAPLRESMLYELRTSGATLRSVHVFGLAGWISMALWIALCFFGAYSVSCVPAGSSSEQSILIFAAGMCVAAGLLSTWGILHSATRVIRLTSSSIEIHSLTFHREIPYAEIHSVSTRQVQTQETSHTLVTIRGSGKKKLLLTRTTPNLSLIVEFLQERAGSAAALAGVEETRAVEKKEQASYARFMIYAAPLYIGLFLGIPLWLHHQAQERLDAYTRIGRLGRTADAIVVDKTTSGGDSTEYLVEYTFAVRGLARPFRSASPVAYDTWERTSIGSKLKALYLPEDPQKCRLQISMRGEISKGLIRESCFYLIFGGLGTAVYLWAVYGLHMRQIGRWKSPDLPAGAAYLASGRVARMRTEVRLIGLARIVGIWIGSGSMALVFLILLLLVSLSSFIPSLHAAMNSHPSPKILNVLLLVPCVCALGGWMALAPLGEAYAFLRTRRLEKEIADPRLASEIITALQRSLTMEKSLSGSTSLRLLNAITVALADPRALELNAEQRSFLYQRLIKSHSIEVHRSFCRVLIPAILIWNEPAGLAALRTVARASQEPDVRDLAIRSLGQANPEPAIPVP